MWISGSANYMRVRDIKPVLPYARVLNTFVFEFTPYSDIPSALD